MLFKHQNADIVQDTIHIYLYRSLTFNILQLPRISKLLRNPKEQRI